MIAVILMGVLSLVGLLFPDSIYPSEELIQSFLVYDVVNLFIGLPILLGSMVLTRRGKLVGFLLWPGALLNVIFNHIAYIFGIPPSLITSTYLALVLLSAFIIFDLLRNIDKEFVQEQLAGAVPVKFAGWVLVIFGVLFSIRAINIIDSASLNQTVLPISKIGVLIADLVLS